jgi:rRNA-processing protein EBP2
MTAAKEAVSRFKAAGRPWLRPADYYAEMVKSDEHMAKVKEQLLLEQRSIAEAEERRKAREMKKYSKQVQAEKQKERAQQKKQDIQVRNFYNSYMDLQFTVLFTRREMG